MDNSLAAGLIFSSSMIRLKFDGTCLTQGKQSNFITIESLYQYQIYIKVKFMTIWLGINFTSESYFFAAAKLTKNADLDKYSYSLCRIGFDARSFFFIVKY